MATDRFSKSKVYKKCFVEIAREAKDKEVPERMRNVCKVLKENLPYYFWVGFYFPRKDFLELGPSIGQPACAQIPHTGVCGKTATSKKPIIVSDVDKFHGHVVCDPRSRSEIALPVFNRSGEVIAVFDVDSKELGSFDLTDQEWLEKILRKVFHI